MKPLKVWHVNNIAEVGPILVKSLKRRGFDAEFRDVEKPLADRPLAIKIFSILTRIRAARRILRAARGENVDLLHIHYSTTAIWFLFGGLPIVVHFHGDDSRCRRTQLAAHVVNWLVCKAAKAVYFSTPDQATYLRRYTKNARFLPNPIDLELFRPQSVAKDLDLIFLNFALIPPKGTAQIFAAVRELKARYPQLRFQTFGFGEQIAEAQAIGIEILKRVRREELPAILSRAGLIVGQVQVGAIGMSELEDFALGRTVICNFEYSHVYSDPSPHVQARSTAELVEAVERYVRDKQTYASIETKCRGWVEKYHDADKSAVTLMAQYQDIFL